MAKTLILSGYAPINDGVEDTEAEKRRRNLARRRAVRATLPRSLRLWDGPVPSIWSANAVRPVVTADELARAFSKTIGSDIETVKKESLCSDDPDRVLSEILSSDERAIAFVGSNELVRRICQRITGRSLEFWQGAVAVIELPNAPQTEPQPQGSVNVGEIAANTAECADEKPSSSRPAQEPEADTSDDAPTGEAAATDLAAVDLAAAIEGAYLSWFVQGPRTEPWETLVELEEIVEGVREQLAERLAAFLEGPDDVETLHKLRVSIRTLRSLLRFLAPFLRRNEAQAAQRDLRSIVVPTSRLRELDVLADEARTLDPPSEELASACLALRQRERDRVLEFLASDKATAGLERIQEPIGMLPWRRRVEAHGLSRDQVSARFDQMEERIESRIGTTDLADAEATHDLRKAAKRVRYAAENFAAFLDPETAKKARRRMKAVQDDLGALCDARVNLEIVTTFPRDGLSDQTLRDLDALEAKCRWFIASKLRVAAPATVQQAAEA